MTWAWLHLALNVFNALTSAAGGLWLGQWAARRLYKRNGLQFRRGAKLRCKAFGHFWMIGDQRDHRRPPGAPPEAPPVMEGFQAQCVYCKRVMVGMSIPPDGNVRHFHTGVVITGDGDEGEQPTVH